MADFSPFVQTTRPAKPPLYDELAKVSGLPEDKMAAAVAEARASNTTLANVLLGKGLIQQADYIEAMHRGGQSVTIDRRDRLPKWDTVFGEDASAGDVRVLVIADSTDGGRRCFMLVTNAAPKDRVMAAMALALRQGYRNAGTIQTTADFIKVLASSAGGSHKAAAVAATEKDESKLQRDFDVLARAALALNASDIHITSRNGIGEVRFRVDGDIEHHQDWTEDYTLAFVSAVYNTMTERGSTTEGFNAAQKLDGAIERRFPEGLVRFRFASAPISPNGYDVVLRLIPLGVKRRQRSITDLGYAPDQRDDLERMFACSSGLIFFLGTTGSGKSTSMAIALEGVARDKPGKKIRTVEQPVEYSIEGAYQTSVARAEFVPMISQMMRMDPDYLMVGETRDQETATAVLQGARSGHLCVSTLHADGALLAYDRLTGLGIPRAELASVGLIAGLVYQRLVPLLCPKCKIHAPDWVAVHGDLPVLTRAKRVNGGMLEGLYVENPAGCDQCRHKGTSGRTVCAEILRPTVGMMGAIREGDSPALLKAWREQIRRDNPAVMRGRTAFEHALWKMRRGLLSPRSVEREFRFLDEVPEDFNASQ